MSANSGKYEAIVIGVSAGGIAALEKILPRLTIEFQLAVIIVQHMAPGGGHYLVEHFQNLCNLPVEEAIDKQEIHPGRIYFAPANYHLLVEREKTFALSTEAKVNFSRPAIDVLFETAADAYCNKLVGIVLTGANADGAAGISRVKHQGGLTVVQSPETAEVDTMPKSAIAATAVDHVLPLQDIGSFIMNLSV